MNLTLPTDSAERKEYPMFTGLLKYFPAALAGVARHSKLGNDKHNPGQPMHHARGKSNDHADCIVRHLTDLADMLAYEDRGELSRAEALDEVNALAWRALALCQELHEEYGAPLAPGAVEPTIGTWATEKWPFFKEVRVGGGTAATQGYPGSLRYTDGTPAGGSR